MRIDQLVADVTAAGLFTNGPRNHHGLMRMIIAAKRSSDGILSGKSFWICQTGDEWILGTWGPRYYRFKDVRSLTKLALDWFGEPPKQCASAAFSTEIMQKYELQTIDYDEFESMQMRPHDGSN